VASPILILQAARDGDGSIIDGGFERPSSPTMSEAFTEISASVVERSATYSPLDSSILFKVTSRESTLLVGRPTAAIHESPIKREQSTSFAVIQVLANILIMFQSIENADTTGNKTIHISIDNLSSLVNTEFEMLPLSVAAPMIGPTGAEFRVVYSTENMGCVVSQDISLACEAAKSCLTPNDLSIMLNITRKMIERMRAFSIGVAGVSDEAAQKSSGRRSGVLSSLIHYQKKGTGIATVIRAEVHDISFVLLRAYKSYSGAPEFLTFSIHGLKAKLEGCMSALSGECLATVAVNFFNAEANDWEYAVESFPVTVGFDQMPNEIVSTLHRAIHKPSLQISNNFLGFAYRACQCSSS
jgi:hypothetical protein